MWPMRLQEGGDSFGFCPAKATWDPEVTQLYRLCQISYETGTMWEPGGLKEQPDWFIELLSWFISVYDNTKFYSRARAILGDGKTKNGTDKRPTNNDFAGRQ